MKKYMTVEELYMALGPLVEEFGELEVRVSYDSGYVSTGIKRDVLPEIRPHSVRFEGY